MTPTSENPIVHNQFVHSCHIKTRHGSAVIVKEKTELKDGTIIPNLRVYENPKRSFYITQNKYRTYRYKPEYELLSRLDKFTVYDHELERSVAQLFNVRGNGNFYKRNELYRSPYIFGADISIEALIKMNYMNQFPDKHIPPTSGFLDIETSIDTNQIILISYTYNNHVFTAALESFFFEEIDNQRVPINKEELLSYVNTNLEGKTLDQKFDYTIEVFDTEIKVIAWIMKKVHESMIDFIGIWNMNFDIPKILNQIKQHNIDPAILFTNPKLEQRFRYLKYHEDMRNVAHFSLKWHWLYSTCGSQFIDSLGLYSQCRRTQGYLEKYDLNSVLDSQLKLGKLPLKAGSHVMMQRHHFKDYIVYNIYDVIGLQLLENKNADILSLSVLADVSPVSKFSAQTIRSTNSIYYNLIGKGMVMSCCSSDDDFIKFDRLFGTKTGGTVLPPSGIKNAGINISV